MVWRDSRRFWSFFWVLGRVLKIFAKIKISEEFEKICSGNPNTHTHTHTHTHTKSSGKVNDIWHATFEIEFFKKIACNNWPKLQPNLLVKITKINYFSLNVFTKIHGIKSVDKNQVKDHSSDKVISIAEVIVSLTGPESAIGFVARMRFKQSVVLPRKNTRFDSSFYMSQKINVSALNFHENWKIRLNAKMRYYNNKTCFLYMNP